MRPRNVYTFEIMVTKIFGKTGKAFTSTNTFFRTGMFFHTYISLWGMSLYSKCCGILTYQLLAYYGAMFENKSRVGQIPFVLGMQVKIFYIIIPTFGTHNGNFLQWMGHLSYSISTMATDELAMWGATASVTIKLAHSSWNILIPATEVFFFFFLLSMCIQVQFSVHTFCTETDILLLFSLLQMISII